MIDYLSGNFILRASIINVLEKEIKESAHTSNQRELPELLPRQLNQSKRSGNV